MTVLSASQIGTFGTTKEGGNNAGCERKWAFKYVARMEDPAGPSAEAGKRIHSYLERWLKEGVTPGNSDKEARIASAMLKHLPPPSKELRVEEPFIFEYEGVKFRGFKDLVYKEGEVLVVHDHKSTSSLSWAKTAEDLRHDAQSIIYAYDGFRESDLVDLSWLYGTREKYPKVQQVRFSISFDEVKAALPPLVRTGKRILALYEKQPDPNTLEPNMAMCEAYGGCPFRHVCTITPLQRIKALQQQLQKEEEVNMGFRDRIKGNTPEVAPVPVQETATPPVARITMREKLGFGSAINPPGLAEQQAPNLSALGLQAAQTTGVSSTVAIVPETAPAEEPKRKPGRPRKTTGIDAAEVLRRDPYESAPSLKPADAQVTPILDAGTEFTLYINCIPSTPWQPLSKYLEPVLADIRAEHGVDDYRAIDYKAAGILGAKLFTALQSSPPRGALVVDRNTREGQDCLGTLERFALTITRGF